MAAGETLVFAHRGAMASAPMNTMAAFELAIAQAADGIELDVQLSRDGFAVVIHDYTVDHTTDGSGNVCDKTLAELKSLDAGSWFRQTFAGARIPTLDEVFYAFGDQLFVNVEIKSTGENSRDIENVVARSILGHEMQDRVIISSFDPQILERMSACLPGVLIGFLYMSAIPGASIRALKDPRHDALHPWHELIDDAYMRWAKANRYFVNAWTVNDPMRALRLRTLGVNAVITDNPDQITAAFSR